MTGQLPLTVMVTNFDQTLKTAKLKSGERERQRQKEEEKRKRQSFSLSYYHSPLFISLLYSFTFLYLFYCLSLQSLYLCFPTLSPVCLCAFVMVERARRKILVESDAGKSLKKGGWKEKGL